MNRRSFLCKALTGIATLIGLGQLPTSKPGLPLDPCFTPQKMDWKFGTVTLEANWKFGTVTLEAKIMLFECNSQSNDLLLKSG